MKDKWRDYRRYTDQQLDDLLKGFAGQADYAEGVFEYQRRQNARREAESRAGHEKTQRLARWAMVFAALSAVGTILGLVQNCSNKAPATASHSETSTAPSMTPLQPTEAQESRQMSTISPPQGPTESVPTTTPDETPEATPEQPVEERSEESPDEAPTPSS